MWCIELFICCWTANVFAAAAFVGLLCDGVRFSFSGWRYCATCCCHRLYLWCWKVSLFCFLLAFCAVGVVTQCCFYFSISEEIVLLLRCTLGDGSVSCTGVDTLGDACLSTEDKGSDFGSLSHLFNTLATSKIEFLVLFPACNTGSILFIGTVNSFIMSVVAS